MFVAGVVVSVLLALVAAASAVPKLAGTRGMLEEATHLGVPRTGYVVIGALELAAAAGLLAGLALPPLGVAAAAGLVLMMAGAVVSHGRAGDHLSAMLPAAGVGVLAAATLALRLATG